ncbi:MAG: hypothetical protein IPP77_02555 [Bacteroidetes bacterium]|nr:hypothetical protein [Bacteroidota bacterium]
MKIRNPVTVFFTALLCCWILSGCADKSNLLVKTWKLEDLRYTREIPTDMLPAIQASISQMKNVFTLTYYADGTYETHMQEQLVKGTWKLNWNNTKIHSTTKTGESNDYTILKLNNKEFEFKAREGTEEVIFVMKASK